MKLRYVHRMIQNLVIEDKFVRVEELQLERFQYFCTDSGMRRIFFVLVKGVGL